MIKYNRTDKITVLSLNLVYVGVRIISSTFLLSQIKLKYDEQRSLVSFYIVRKVFNFC